MKYTTPYIIAAAIGIIILCLVLSSCGTVVTGFGGSYTNSNGETFSGWINTKKDSGKQVVRSQK